MRAPMWISYAEWPLSPDGLCHALGIELGSPDFNPDNIPSITTLVSCCQGPMIVYKVASYVPPVFATGQSVRPEGRTRTDGSLSSRPVIF